MPRFFFNVRDIEGDVSVDREGQELPGLEEARAEAVNANREMLGERLLHGGKLDNRCIEIVDSSGRVLASVTADDVLFKDDKYRSYSDDVTKSAPVARPTSPKPSPE